MIMKSYANSVLIMDAATLLAEVIVETDVIGEENMNKYELWLDSIKSDRGKYELYELGHKGNVRLFQLKEYYWKNHFKFAQVNYHIWNVKSLKWRVVSDYRTSCSIFNIEVEDDAYGI